MLLTILLILLVLALFGGGFGHGRGYGYYSWGPLGFLLIVLLILWAIGALR